MYCLNTMILPVTLQILADQLHSSGLMEMYLLCSTHFEKCDLTLLVGSIFHMSRKIVSEMTYNVSMGTLNPTILYYYTVIWIGVET